MCSRVTPAVDIYSFFFLRLRFICSFVDKMPTSFFFFFNTQWTIWKSQVMSLIKTESTFISVNFSLQPLAMDKVVVDDGRYTTSSPVVHIILLDSYARTRISCWKVAAECLSMEICTKMELLCPSLRQREERKKKPTQIRSSHGFDKNSQSTVCD